MRRTLWALGAFATVIAATPPALAQKSEDTLRIGFYQPVRLVDPYFQPGPEGTLVTRMVFDTPVNYDAVKKEFVSGIAESWKRIDDLTMEFKLRKGIKWHDGEPLTMDDVEYTYEFAMHPKVNYRFKATRINWIDSFQRVDDETFRIKSNAPMAVMLAKMTNFPSVFPKHVHGKLAIDEKNKFGLNAVGSGPFRVVEHDPSTGVLMAKNKDYKHGNPGKPEGSVGKVRVDPVPDHQTQVARLLTGEQDLMYNVDKEQALILAENPDFNVDVQDAVSFTYMMFDAKDRSGIGIFTDRRVRQAFMHAVDREQLRKLVHPEVADEPALQTVCHPWIRHCASTKAPPEYDPAKAKKLLAEAGYPDGIEKEIPILNWGEARPTAEAVAGMLRQIGVNASVNTLTFGSFVKARAKGEPLLVTLWDNSVGQPDIDNTASYFFLPTSRNYNKDPELEKLANMGRSALDPEQRTEHYQKMFDLATERAYLYPLHRLPAVVVHHKNVKLLGGHKNPKGFEPNRVTWN